MGIFGRSKDPQATHIDSLILQYAQAYAAMGVPAAEAKQQAQQFVLAGIADVNARGWQNQPVNYGDQILSQESSNPQLAESLARLRREGVTDADIKGWWNMTALDRVLIEKSDEQNRTAAFLACLEQGMDGDEAAAKTFQANPRFGNPTGDGDPDGPIPIELKMRIVEWSERHQASPKTLAAKLANCSSFNALVRSEIASGAL